VRVILRENGTDSAPPKGIEVFGLARRVVETIQMEKGDSPRVIPTAGRIKGNDVEPGKKIGAKVSSESE